MHYCFSSLSLTPKFPIVAPKSSLLLFISAMVCLAKVGVLFFFLVPAMVPVEEGTYVLEFDNSRFSESLNNPQIVVNTRVDGEG